MINTGLMERGKQIKNKKNERIDIK